MSNSLTRLCRPLRMSPAQKSVLMCLADRADDEGLTWPSIPGICEWTCLSRTAVITAMHWLESQGVVAIEKAVGKNNRCVLSIEWIAANQPVILASSHPSASRTGTADAPVRQTHPTSTAGAPPPVREADYTRAADAPEASIHQSSTNTPEASAVHSTPERPTKKAKPAKNFAVIPDELLPEQVPVDAWRSYVEMREAIKSPMTVAAQTLLLTKVARLHDAGEDARELLELATVANWKSVYPSRQADRSKARGHELSADEQFRGAI